MKKIVDLFLYFQGQWDEAEAILHVTDLLKDYLPKIVLLEFQDVERQELQLSQAPAACQAIMLCTLNLYSVACQL